MTGAGEAAETRPEIGENRDFGERLGVPELDVGVASLKLEKDTHKIKKKKEAEVCPQQGKVAHSGAEKMSRVKKEFHKIFRPRRDLRSYPL